ncbi:MAG: hypothetical protein ACYCVZ_06040 [Streptosporangiaceae bacterium]
MTVLASSNNALAQPGTIAFLIIFGMAVLLYFVFRSMSRHLRKVTMAARADAEEAARREAGEAAKTGADSATGD